MITDHIFLYESEVGPVCDEISVYAAIALDTIPTTGSQFTVEEFSESPRAEAALQPETVGGGKKKIRVYIGGETDDQVRSQVDDFTLNRRRTRSSVVPESIRNPVRGGLVMLLSYIEPKAIKGQGSVRSSYRMIGGSLSLRLCRRPPLRL